MKLREWWEKATEGERNAMVAEKVMGWTPCGDHSGLWFRESEYRNWLSDFQGDIAAAWLVVEKMRERTGVAIISYERAINSWHVEFERYEGEDAPTVEHCVCLAALAACGVEEV